MPRPCAHGTCNAQEQPAWHFAVEAGQPPTTPETPQKPALATTSMRLNIDVHLQMSTSQPWHSRGSAGRRGEAQGVSSPNQCCPPLARPGLTLPAPIPARADGCPRVLHPNPIPRQSYHTALGPSLPAGGSTGQTTSTHGTTAKPGSEALFTAYNLYPCLLLTASSSLGGAELPAGRQQTVGWDNPAASIGHTDIHPQPILARAPAWILRIPPAEELLQRHCKKTWEITHACDISN